MERSRTQGDEAERVAMTVGSAQRTGASTAMMQSGTRLMTGTQTFSAGDVTHQALHLALSALQIDLAWHAGVVSAEAAMKCLHHEIGETVKRWGGSPRASSPDRAISHCRLERPCG
jgi:hypothetical protein